MKINPLLSSLLSKIKALKIILELRKSLYSCYFLCPPITGSKYRSTKRSHNLSFNSISVGQLIEEIEKQTDYLVVYSNREIDTNRQVIIQNKSAKVSSYLKETLAK